MEMKMPRRENRRNSVCVFSKIKLRRGRKKLRRIHWRWKAYEDEGRVTRLGNLTDDIITCLACCFNVAWPKKKKKKSMSSQWSRNGIPRLGGKLINARELRRTSWPSRNPAVSRGVGKGGGGRRTRQTEQRPEGKRFARDLRKFAPATGAMTFRLNLDTEDGSPICIPDSFHSLPLSLSLSLVTAKSVGGDRVPIDTSLRSSRRHAGRTTRRMHAERAGAPSHSPLFTLSTYNPHG